MYTEKHTCFYTSLSNFLSGNESEVDDLAGRSSKSRRVTCFFIGVSEGKKKTFNPKKNFYRIRERERKKKREKEHNN